ncbi:MAG: helix-turn-helix transcriptional regulator [Sulfitobacter sp.]
MQYLSDKSLATRFSVCRTTIWRWSREGDFPKPVKLGGATRWGLPEIEAWESQQADCITQPIISK